MALMLTMATVNWSNMDDLPKDNALQSKAHSTSNKREHFLGYIQSSELSFVHSTLFPFAAGLVLLAIASISLF